MNVVVLGGNMTGKFYRYFKQLGVTEFRHIILTGEDNISQQSLEEKARNLRWAIVPFYRVIAVGKFADRLLNIMGVPHGFLPLTKVTSKQLEECRTYLRTGGVYAIS